MEHEHEWQWIWAGMVDREPWQDARVAKSRLVALRACSCGACDQVDPDIGQTPKQVRVMAIMAKGRARKYDARERSNRQ